MVNISSVNLTPAHISVLFKGLSFCPSPRTDWFQLEMDIQHVIRRLKLRVWFHGKQPTQPVSDSRVPVFRLHDLQLSVKSDFMPMLHCPAIETYVNLVKAEVEGLKVIENDKPLLHPNMSREEIQALQELDQNHALTIKSADKGWGRGDGYG